MNIEAFREYCLSKKGVTESIPFSKLPDILVFKVMGKMFTVVDLSTFDGFSIKCDPSTIEELRARYACVNEPTYFSKKHWSFVTLDGSVEDNLLYRWLDTSYHLVVANLSRKLKLELEQL